MNPPYELAVILVSYNVRSLLLDALRTLYDDLSRSGLNNIVYVVDNASADGTPEAVRTAFPQTSVIAESRNVGFGAGNNIALRALGFCDQPTPNPNGPRAVLLLNPDTLIQPGALRTLYDALFDLPHAGVVGAQLAYEDGSFQHGAFRFPSLLQLVIDLFPVPGRFYESSLNGRYARALYKQAEPFPVDHTLGATMLLRREVIEQTGLFDEQFFMYCEEVDWSMRIRRAGWQIYLVPAARITHLESKSAGQDRPQRVINLWESRFKLYAKHDSPLKRTLTRLIVRAGMRRRIRLTQQDSSLSDDQRVALVNAYRKVMSL